MFRHSSRQTVARNAVLDDTVPVSLSEVEFAVLRRTIAVRGTVRVTLFPFTMIAWAFLASATLGRGTMTALFPLAVLVGGFEAVHALHVGVERVGRYLQVYYEDSSNSPRWET